MYEPRALVAMGVTGKLIMRDAKTDKHRTTINIEAAAKLNAVLQASKEPRGEPAAEAA